MEGPRIITLGCRLNIAESEAMREAAAGADDLVIVNSCAVTSEAVTQTRRAIRRARRGRPDARIIVTGCAAQIDPAAFSAMPEVDRVIGNGEKSDPSHYRFGKPGDAPFADDARVRVSDIMAVKATAPHLAAAFAEHSRAFVEVQNGCDHRCTFCIIPYGRGNSRSVPAGAVIDRVRELVDQGFREIVLTGVDVTSYGADLPGSPTLGLLVERLLKHVPGLPRLRLSSLDSVEIDDRLFDLITGEERMMPHLHLSMQSGDDMILKRMKRRHQRADAIRLVERIKARRPGVAIGADIIAGFPTESEDMFEQSLALVEECDIVHGHIFPYSPRTGTPAARMPQVATEAIKARAARLRTACAERNAAWLASLRGTVQEVLVERSGTEGYAANFARVRLDGPPVRPGTLARVTISGASDRTLIGKTL